MVFPPDKEVRFANAGLDHPFAADGTVHQLPIIPGHNPVELPLP